MLSIAEPEGSDFKVVMNSTVSGVRPSPDKWTFLKGRDISLIQKFEAGKYLVVPRILASDNMPEQVPYVLGVIANKEIGAGEVDIKFSSLDASSEVFMNHPKFNAALTSVDDVQFQKRPPGAGFPATLQGNRLE
ncbi:calpain-like cysteine peptidase [Angomonas deanei]|nr:calpain-like cysteine peptidase [Angomonas deanei]|eukprot:EPY41841.1 calpain-like cysteine peptidase [Angomonas deanei]